MSRQLVRYMALGSLVWFAVIYWVHQYVDFPVALYIHEQVARQSRFYHLADMITHLGYTSVALAMFFIPFVISRFVCHCLVWTRRFLFMLQSMVVAGLVTDLLKMFFGRPRPKLFFNDGLQQFYWWHHRPMKSYDFVSFPSGHATIAAAIGVGVMLSFPRWRWLGVVFMLFVAASRVILLDHYVADVMAGMYVGVVTSLLFYRYYYVGRPAGRLWRWLEGCS